MTASNLIGRVLVLPLVNKSGGGVVLGDVVVIDTANSGSFTTTTSAASTAIIGVAQDTIANNATGRVMLQGYTSLVNVNASVTLGHYGQTHTVAKQAADAGASRQAGTFCQFLTGGTTPDAMIWPTDLGGGSGAPSTADYLTGTAQAGLSAEIVVGTSPGGELGGTWASPTVDATHSGSTHLLPGNTGLLAVHSYAPTQTILSTTSATFADVDATNMVITFTAPASTNVIVRLTSYCDSSAGDYAWGLRESTTNLAGTGIVTRNNGGNTISLVISLAGISAGSHTYKWAHAVSAGTGRIIVGPGTAGSIGYPPGVMEVFAAP